MSLRGPADWFRTVHRACLVVLNPGRITIWVVLLAAGLLLDAGCCCGRRKIPTEKQPSAGQSQSAAPATVQPAAPAPVPAAKEPEPKTGSAPVPGEEISLFDGQTLGPWKVTDFGGQGNVHVKDGAIYLEMGSYATGIAWTGPVVRMNYEITLDAMRAQGNDFFCGLTFPVGENPCTLILGGWGGSLCGLSSLDHFDASENETTKMLHFDNGKWYHVRLRVVPNRIQVWLDDQDLVDVDVTGRKIDIRPEIDLSQPLGIATWVTTGAVKNIRLKKLPEQTQ